ncbi:MAG: hypothetical protein KAQ69_00320 [Spirochaetales bacterium]|nr:hypothetical protein [Spirochaetales bacterium]
MGTVRAGAWHPPRRSPETPLPGHGSPDRGAWHPLQLLATRFIISDYWMEQAHE